MGQIKVNIVERLMNRLAVAGHRGKKHKIILGTSTGTMFGTSTSQKLGFFGTAAIAQPGATTDLGTVLSNLGLRASGTAYPITTSGAVTLGSLTSLNGRTRPI